MRQEERRARTRAALVREAAVAFAREGYEATSLDAIVSAAGYSKGALYANFRSKQELFAAAIEELLEEARGRTERVAEAAGRGAGLLDAARAYWQDDRTHTHAGLMREAWALAGSQPDIRSRLEAQREARRAMLGQALVDAGLAPAGALERAEVLARLIDAEIVERQLQVAAGS